MVIRRAINQKIWINKFVCAMNSYHHDLIMIVKEKDNSINSSLIYLKRQKKINKFFTCDLLTLYFPTEDVESPIVISKFFINVIILNPHSEIVCKKLLFHSINSSQI